MRALLLLTLVLGACANPVPPTGGPPDREPPRLVASVPEPSAVNVASPVIRLTFSEAVDQQSLARALSITPEPGTPPRLSWKGRTVEIDVGALLPNTTYILTIDNTFRDARGVALATPLTLAFSTGATLNSGRIAGTVREPLTGTGVPGIDVFAYQIADTITALPARPLYRTQTSANGDFAFEYLGPGPFFVVAVRDANRNTRVDAGEAIGVPPAFALSPDTAAIATPFLLSQADTTAPTVERVRSYSAIRHALRLREGVARAEGEWRVADSTGAAVPILQRYQTRIQPREVFFVTPPLSRQPYTLSFGGIVDSAGNILPGGLETWMPTAARDTFALRFEGFIPSDGLLQPGQEGAVRFSLPLPDSLRARLVTVQTPDGSDILLALTSDSTTTYTFPVADSLTVIVHAERLGAPEAVSQTFVAPGARDLGGIEGVVAAPDATLVVVELTGDDGAVVTARPDNTGRFRLSGLLPGTYTLRAFEDINRDGRWNGGTLIPYRPAERIGWATEPVEVRARWDNALPDTLRFSPFP